MVLVISSFITKEFLALFLFYLTLTRIINAAAIYRLRAADKNKDFKIAIKNFYFSLFINKIILAVPILALALKIILFA